jgi:predicted DNA-binding transcriptional regulator YafY
MNRIERISAILIQLQSKKIVKAQEIADRFEISLRTVYRDVRALEETGVPIIGEAGVGYSLVDGYRLPPIMFTKEEAMAFITAEKLVQRFTDSTTQNSYNSALYKIKAVLKTTEKNDINTLSDHIDFVKNRTKPSSEIESSLQSILKSIIERKQIKIEYFTNYSQEKSIRVVEPVGIYHDNYWYMIAFCLLRNDYRNFKINRISSLEMLEISFLQKHPALKSFLEKTWERGDLKRVVINVEKKAMRYLGDEKYYQGFVSQRNIEGDFTELTFLTSSLMGFAIWYRMYESHAQIIEPVELKTMVIDQIKSLVNKYKI